MQTHFGFTLIEILVVMGLITILASVVLIAINPVRQFAQARNSQRISNTHAILNAVGNRLADNRGLFADGAECVTELPSSATRMATGAFDIRPCLVPTYLAELPADPTSGSNTCSNAACSGGEYDTGYTIVRDSQYGRITVCAPEAAESAIPGSEAYCLTR